jgi:cation transport regulator ChaC
LKLYFAYGSNMESTQMRAASPDHLFVGAARLDGYRLEFRRRSIRWRGGAADIVRAPAERVWGALYELSDSAFAMLDRKEAAGLAYERILVQVELDGRRVEAAAYAVIAKEPKEVPPTPDYVRSMLVGARERGLPDEYVAFLQARAR